MTAATTIRLSFLGSIAVATGDTIATPTETYQQINEINHNVNRQNQLPSRRVINDQLQSINQISLLDQEVLPAVQQNSSKDIPINGTDRSLDVPLSPAQKPDNSHDVILSSPLKRPAGKYDHILPPPDYIQEIYLEGIGLTLERTVESYKKAIIKFKEAIELSKRAKSEHTQAMALSSLANAYNKLEDKQNALNYYKQSLEIWRRMDDSQYFPPRQKVAHILDAIGDIYSDLGGYQKALEYHNQSVTISRAIDMPWDESSSLNAISLIYGRLGKKQKAFQYMNQALEISERTHSKLARQDSIINMGIVYQYLDSYELALKYLHQGLEFSRSEGSKSYEARILNNIGIVYYKLGDKQKSLDYYNQALLLQRSFIDRFSEVSILDNIAILMSSQEHTELAITLYKQSVNLYESIRRDIHKFPREDQETYTKSIADTYHRLADLLLKQNRTIEALQVLDLLKVQDLQDFIKDFKGNDRTRKGVELFPEEQAILTAFNNSSDNLNTFLKSSPIQTQIQSLKTNATAQNLQLKTYSDLQTRDRKAHV